MLDICNLQNKSRPCLIFYCGVKGEHTDEASQKIKEIVLIHSLLA